MPKDYPSGAQPYSAYSWGNPKRPADKPAPSTMDYNDKRRRAARAVPNQYAADLEKRSKRSRDEQKVKSIADDYSRRGRETREGQKGFANKTFKNAAERRAYRIQQGAYKGRYYGPDAFKGDMNIQQAWRKAGSPKDTKAFAEGFRNRTKARS